MTTYDSTAHQTLSGDDAVAEDTTWFCIHTAPLREEMVAEYLTTRDFVIYNPMLKAKRKGRVNGRDRIMEPLFPRYLFAQFNPDAHVSKVRYAPGVAGIVSGLNGPIPVPDSLIREIHSNLDNSFYTTGRLRQGDRIEIESGPLKGTVGIFQSFVNIKSKDRVRVLMELIQRPVVVEFHSADIKRVTTGSRPCLA